MYRVRNLTRNPVFVDSYEVFPPYTDVYVSAISPDIGNAQAKGHLMVTDLSSLDAKLEIAFTNMKDNFTSAAAALTAITF